MRISSFYKHMVLFRIMIVFVIGSMIMEFLFPISAYALTNGPTQPEVQSYTPIGVSDIVNPATGTYNYSIPLFEDFPISIGYSPSANMDAEPSIVGLDWTLNVGSITHGVNGLSDDFAGDKIKKEYNIRDNITKGLEGKLSIEFLGKETTNPKGKVRKFLENKRLITPTVGIFENNYRGMGASLSFSPGFSLLKSKESNLSLGLGLDFGYDSQQGFNFAPSLALNMHKKDQEEHKVEVGLNSSISQSFNSRAGLGQLSLKASLTRDEIKKSKKEGKMIRRSYGFVSVGSTLSFAKPSYTPTLSMPFETESFDLNATVGAEIAWFHPSFRLRGYSSVQKLVNNEREVGAYGYLYREKAKEEEAKNNGVLLDFNREKDGLFMPKVNPNLPLARQTYDTYSVLGPNVGGTFRAWKDPGFVYDEEISNPSVNQTLGVEAGIGADWHAGINYSRTDISSRTGRWETGFNGLKNTFNNSLPNSNDPLYEPFYFKQVGQLSVEEDMSAQENIGNDKAVRVKVGMDAEASAEATFVDNNKALYSGPFKRKQRTKRNQVILPLTANDAQYAAINKAIPSYHIDSTYADSSLAIQEYIERAPAPNPNKARKGHHISSMEVVKEDGSRYLYEIPAYNNLKREVSFNVSGRPDTCQQGLVSYQPGIDNSINNKNGLDNYFDAVETPGYAYAYLLTHVLSPDYQDVSGDGISEDDPGTAWEIKYSRVHKDFKWRTPLGQNKANYNPKYEVYEHDDIASYIYGEKEIWYVKAIESKHTIIEFEYSNRESSYGVVDENGALDFSKAEKKLDQITMYAKEDRFANGDQAFPIKKVNFTYDYSLCQGVPNNSGNVDVKGYANQGGKLTLKSVQISYGDSERGKFNPYKFYYADYNHDGVIDPAYNPDYNLKARDKWGNYKPNDCHVDSLDNAKFPYTKQDASTDIYAQAWCLTGIKTPSGGRINLHLEGHDYAYVGPHKSMQMFKVLGLGNTQAYNNQEFLYKGDSNYDYVYFKLTGSMTKEEVGWKYLTDASGKKLGDLQFNFYTAIDRVDGRSGPGRKYEHIKGYAQIEDWGITADPSIAWIKVKEIGIRNENSNKKISAFTHSIFHKIRLGLADFIYPGANPNATGEAGIRLLAGFAASMKEVFKGIHAVMKGYKIGNHIKKEKSWIRLYTPDGFKKGGSGPRVAKIETINNWDNFTQGSGLAEVYGQEYDYGIEEFTGAIDQITKRAIKETISSGVAAWEPMIGGDENPYYKPVRLTEPRLLAQNKIITQDAPYGESFAPAPNIVYRQVKVKNLSRSGLKRHATGFMQYDFYSAKEYPIVFDQTELDGIQSSKWQNFFKRKEVYRGSQGYVVKRNNMHGQSKSVKVFQEGASSPLAGTEYIYRSKPHPENKSAWVLDNDSISVVFPDKQIKQAQIGIDIDIVVDEREHESKTYGVNFGGNYDQTLGIPIPSLWPFPTKFTSRFNSMVVSKVVDLYGLLDTVVSFDGSSRISSKTLAYDSETGAPLLSQVRNEFNEPIYNFNYPAHWAYDRMGPAYKNIGASWESTSINDLVSNGNSQYFVKGDELLMDRELGWVLAASTGPDALEVVDRFGVLMDKNKVYDEVKIIRSGRRNQQATSIGNLITGTNPLSDSLVTFSEVLGAGAVEFSDEWQINCGTLVGDTTCACNILTQEAKDLEVMLDGMASRGALVDQSYTLNSTSEYMNSSLYSTITPALNPGCNPYFTSTSTSTSNNCAQDINISFSQTCAGSSICTINLQADSSNKLCLEYVTKFQNLKAKLDPQALCNDSYEFTVEAVIEYSCYGGVDDTLTLTGSTDCFPVRSCPGVVSYDYLCAEPGEVLNPFTNGIRGNFSPLKSYTYLTPRGTVNPTTGVATDVRNEGYFQNFSPFWNWSGTEWQKDDQDWTWTAEVTKRIPEGYDVESKDPLNRYSSSLYGYQQKLPMAVAANARLYEIASADFEVDDDIGLNCSAHITIGGSSWASTNAYSHSGKQSLEIGSNGLASIGTNTTQDTCTDGADDIPYTLKECDCSGVFAPKAGERYVASFWVFSDAFVNNSAPRKEHGELKFEVLYNDGSAGSPANLISPLATDEGNLIEGWQRIEVIFDLPANATQIELQFSNQSSTAKLFVDDFRFHPFLGDMQTYVYDPITRRLLASGDAKGFFTFYQYDLEGSPVSIKQETERGIVTLQENRNFLQISDD